jgi:hypothetical protein
MHIPTFPPTAYSPLSALMEFRYKTTTVGNEKASHSGEARLNY